MDQIIPAGEVLLTNTGATTNIVEVAANQSLKFVALYFSMHDCPPCQAFTPVFSELYREVN